RIFTEYANMKKILLHIGSLVLVFGLAMPVAAQPIPTASVKVDSLTLEKAIALGLQYNPSIQSAEGNLRSQSAVVTENLSTYYPVIGASAGVTRAGGAFVLNPSIPPRSQTYDTYVAGISASQDVFDFGRTQNHVSAANSLEKGSSARYELAKENVEVNVEIAYYGYIQTDTIVGANVEAVQQAEKHLQQSKAFYTVGTRPKTDVTNAEVNLVNANINLIHARNQEKLAEIQLEQAIGVRLEPGYKVSRLFPIPVYDVQLDSVEAQALEVRPEILNARERLEANKSLEAAAWDGNLPSVSANASYNWTNFNFPLFSKWSAGVTFSLPIFQGMLVSGQADEMQAYVDTAQANLEVLTQSVSVEIEQNYYSMKEARDRIDATDQLVAQATENLDLVQKQYAAGTSSQLDVIDAQVTLTNARITRIQAEYDYNTGIARFRKSIGLSR
ncbi:MAG TPA: TolC family protein, partial [Bacteroidota bacterium]|nr:TolC family protein [Bacteroidota bacterium]